MQKSERSLYKDSENKAEDEPEWIKRILDVYERIRKDREQTREIKDD